MYTHIVHITTQIKPFEKESKFYLLCLRSTPGDAGGIT